MWTRWQSSQKKARPPNAGVRQWVMAHTARVWAWDRSGHVRK